MPAAAVIPAPIAYIKVVAVKKLVVGFLAWDAWPAPDGVCAGCILSHPSGTHSCRLFVEGEYQIFYFEEIRVFKAGFSL